MGRLNKKYKTDHFQDLVYDMAAEIFAARCLDKPYVVDDEGNETLTEEKQQELNDIHTWVENKFEDYVRNLDGGRISDDDLVEIASKLSNEDICKLIHMFHDRIDVFIGGIGRSMVCGGLSKDVPANINGTIVQINTEYTDEGNELGAAYSEYFIEEVESIKQGVYDEKENQG